MLAVSHHDDNKAELLRACLVPEALRLQEEFGTSTVFLERHWLRGPHVRFTLPADLSRTRMSELRTRIETYLSEHPSTEHLDPTAYAAVSERLGRAELVRPPYEPLRDNNTVEIEEYPADSSVELLGATGYHLKREFLAHAVQPLSRALAKMVTGTSRLELAFTLLVANAARWPVGGLASGQLSYRSHLEDYLAVNDHDGRMRTAIAAQFDRAGEYLRAVFRDQVEHTVNGVYTGSDEYLRAWSAVFDGMWPQTMAQAARESLTEDLGDGYLATARTFDDDVERQWRFGADRPSSEFHHELNKLNYLPGRVNVTEFAAYRFMTNQTTRFLPLLGVSPAERYFLSYAVSELVEAEFGVNWRDQLSAIQADPNARISGSDRG
jgi:hypothetical protein